MLIYLGTITVPVVGLSRNNTTTGRSVLNLGALGSFNTDSRIAAYLPGVGGDAWTYAQTGRVPDGHGVIITVNVPGKTVSVSYESGVSAVGDIEAAIVALSAGSIVLDKSGTVARVLTGPGDDIAATPLAGGAPGAFLIPLLTRHIRLRASGGSLAAEVFVSPSASLTSPSTVSTTATRGYPLDATGIPLDVPSGEVASPLISAIYRGAGASTVDVFKID